MDKGLHEKALDAAIAEAVAAPGVSMFRSSADRDKWVMHSAIAAYLKTAGLTVVPVEPTREMIYAKSGTASCDIGVFNRAQFKAMIAAFPSPFKETP